MVIGRFQMFHNGHEELIDTALELCERVVVFVGSSQESGTSKNPFDFKTRKEMIECCFPAQCFAERLVVCPLQDIGVGDNTSWGKYVIEEFKKVCWGFTPDLYISGCEKERSSWFSDELAPTMNELRISRNKNAVSATECRKYLTDNDFDSWKNCVPVFLYGKFNWYRTLLEY